MAIVKKFIGLNQVDGARVLLDNEQTLRAKSSGGIATDLLKLDSSGKLQLLVMPEVASDASSANQLVRKSQLDAAVGNTGADLSALQDAFDAFVATKGQVGGLAELDVAGLVPASQLPSYVDDVLEFANFAAFPATGEQGKIYVAIDTSKCYRWSGSTYIQITSGAVDSVNGQLGIVSLDGSDLLSASNTFGGMTIDASLDALQGGIDATGDAVSQEILDRQAADALLLPLAGGTMSGGIDMGGFDLLNVGAVQAGYLQIDSASASSIISGTSITLDTPVVYVSSNGSPGTIETNGGAVSAASVTGALFELSDDVGLSFSGANGQVTLPNGSVLSEVGLSFATAGSIILFTSMDGVIDGLAAPSGDLMAANKGYVDAAIDQEVLDRDAAIAVETGRATGAESALSGRLDVLEADPTTKTYVDGQLDLLSVEQLVHERFVLSSGDITAGKITVAHTIVGKPMVMVGRVVLCPTDDFTVSGADITWAGPVAAAGAEALAEGDVVTVYYHKAFAPFAA